MDTVLKLIESIDNPQVVSLIVTIAIVIITSVFLWFYKRRSAQKKHCLLIGITNSGKTALYCQLAFNTQLLTQISITPNSGTATIDKSVAGKQKTIDIVDIPGQDKVRQKFLDAYKKMAGSLIVVIDSSTFQQDAREVSNFVYKILNDDVLMGSKMKILVACNKQDIEFCKGSAFIKSTLEKEIELLRKLSNSSLQSTDSKSDNKMKRLSSNSDKPFEFSDLRGVKVDFCESSTLTAEGLKPIKEWIVNV